MQVKKFLKKAISYFRDQRDLNEASKVLRKGTRNPNLSPDEMTSELVTQVIRGRDPIMLQHRMLRHHPESEFVIHTAVDRTTTILQTHIS